jgi:hypothetical protein
MTLDTRLPRWCYRCIQLAKAKHIGGFTVAFTDIHHCMSPIHDYALVVFNRWSELKKRGIRVSRESHRSLRIEMVRCD